MGAAEWLPDAQITGTDWTTIEDALEATSRDVTNYQKLIISIVLVTAPAGSNVEVRVQHSADKGIVAADSIHWNNIEDMSQFSFGVGDLNEQKTQTTTAFQGWIRVQARCTDDYSGIPDTAKISVYIGEK